MIWTKDFSLRLAASRVRASNAETIEEIINGESAELSDANVKSLFNREQGIHRVVQPDFTQEIEALCTVIDRSLSI